ncbi:MAG TPA: Hint domain-containing protein [Candidatus Limnocylindrales bacterium]|nr:Hint domain-containing protein [Candidatus Limnocylindrales bacterium]
MTKRLGWIGWIVAAVLGAALAGCVFFPSPPAGAEASPSFSGSPGPGASQPPSASLPSSGPLTEGQLRLAIVEQLGERWYCDPDEYPVARFDQQQRAIERFDEMRADADNFRAAAGKLGLDPNGDFTPEQKLAVYQLWKVLISIPMDPFDAERFHFDYLAVPVGNKTEGTHTTGTIDIHGAITIDEQVPAGEPPCPICLARGTLIDTPAGAIAVERLQIGDAIWTTDAAGHRVAGVIIALGSTPAPPGHEVVSLRLADGRGVTASPGHPLADGRRLGDIRAGDVVDGSQVITASLVRYDAAETMDLLASGATGGYYAGGIPLQSTLSPP